MNISMNISLVCPPQTELKEPLSYISLGLGYLASSLIKEGFENVIIDNLAGIGIDNVKLGRADVYGITYMSVAEEGVKTVVNYIREKYPESKIILGGPHPSVDPIDAYINIRPDTLIAGEGEKLLPKLISNHKYNMYNAGVIEDLDSLPFPERRLFDYDNVVNTSGIHGCEKGVKATTLICSRGCPFDCKFCCREHSMYSKWRYRSAENVRDELIELKEDYDIQHVRFVDDCFSLVKDRVRKICKYTKELDITFMCITRADTSNLDTLKILKDGGCTTINIGVESGSNRLLLRMNKRETIEQIKKCIINAKSIGLKTKVLLQYDLPEETKDDIQKTMDFLKETKPDYYTLSKFSPLPGSKWCNIKKKDKKDIRGNGWFYNDNDTKRNRLINEIESILYG